ncbi:peptidoglycan-binding domain-containing protein [Leisingera sp. McT4-56]|uniref:peptidoglycan-binding domain-containing protein n=1 Tax=Leisingera sp. McT4-56 TaxID=2881255 RepID=UPI001CF8A57A|nr:peptidoglycan-binding domain-containing protein [Leisingera sp. McT4-56]MCB4455827.1 peptidoglycan-binding protein [Leisingera sp. McT4-56]
MFRSALIFAVCLIISLAPRLANALTLDQAFALQIALKDHGFDPGGTDGRIGPATRRALKEFSEKYGSKSDPESVYLYMYSRSLDARSPITNEKILEVITRDVAKNLRDPNSVMIRDVFFVKKGAQEIVCGEVNGKNAYGGYAGFTKFYGLPVVMDHFPLMSINNSEVKMASVMCDLAFPKKP